VLIDRLVTRRTRTGRLLPAALTAVLAVAALLSLPAAPAAAEETTLLPSRVVLLSSTAPVKTWADVPVRVRVEAEDGTPLAGRSVRFWDDSYERWRCCGPPPLFTTDANGEAATVLNLDGNSAHPVRVAVLVYASSTHARTSLEWYQQLVGYQTTVSMTGVPAAVTSSDSIALTVTAARTDAASPDGCLEGAVVHVDVTGPDAVSTSATVDERWEGTRWVCDAVAVLPAGLSPGAYVVTASTGHEGWSRTDEPAATSSAFTVVWQHRFTDAAGRGSVYLNPATDDYRVVLADGRDSGLTHAGEDGLSKTGVSGTVSLWRIDLAHEASSGDRAEGTFYSTGSFTASGSLAGQPWQLSR